MFIRKCAEVLLVGTLVLGTIEANAAASRGENDGCAVLGQLVTSQLDALSAGLFITRLQGDTGGSVPMPDAPGYCATTAATVSRAFGGAMINAGIPVSWGDGPLVPIDYCMDRYLPHCYPLFGPPVTAQERSFVHDAWKAISRSVADSMPYGVGSDMAVFDRRALKSSLAINLRYELSIERNASGRATR